VRIGVDLGGTKIEAIALDRGGRERARRRVPTPRDRYAATLAAITTLVEGLEREGGEPARVGIGMPGALSPATGLVKNANSVWLNGRPLREDLERLLHRPLRFANDANCFALSEARDGAGAGARVVFGVILGTGTGGGIAVDGRVLTGPNAIAGEWGHNPLPWPDAAEVPGPACPCGKPGCMELYLSGPGLQRDHARTAGETLDARTIVTRAEGGDPACRATFDRYIDRLARGMASLINLFDPDVIVVGGGLSHITSLYERVPARWTRYLTGEHCETRFVPNKHGDASGVRGAAHLWS
jgi:fructokinase